MANYSQLTAAQQNDIDVLMQLLSPLMGEFARFLTRCSATDAQYISRASAALAAMVSSQFSGTNLVAANGNGTAPTITSATHNFSSDEVGNLVNITAGTNWTTGLYEIKSVAANAATLDRACATVAAPTSGTWAIRSMVPNKVNLSAAAAAIWHDDIVSMVSHIESALASFDDTAHRNIWVQCCGPANMI